MRTYGLLIGVLVVWRVTHLISAEDGPLDILYALRKKAGAGFWGTLMDCFYCLSLWISIPFAVFIGESWRERLLLWPALSAGAILLERSTTGRANQQSIVYRQDPEIENGMLRQEERKAERPTQQHSRVP
jgi:hypothetical protein